MASVYEAYQELRNEIESKLNHFIEISNRYSKWSSNKCIPLYRIINNCDYDEIIEGLCGNVVLVRNGYDYSLSSVEFEDLCEWVDTIEKYYENGEDNHYTEEEIDEMTFEELQELVSLLILPDETKKYLQDIFDNYDINDEDYNYIEKYRNAVKKVCKK